MKKTIIFLLFFCLFFAEVNAEDCKYTSEIEECDNAFEDGETLSIEDFVCINDKSPEKRIYQIVLDKKFKEIDKQAEESLSKLEESKDYYFGEKKKEDFLEATNLIESTFWWWKELYLKYKPLCDSEIVQETINCLPKQTTTVNRVWDFLKDQKGDCLWLVETKLKINTSVAYNILKLNKEKTRQDSKKTYVQKERTFYDKLSELFSINAWFLERIWKKTPTYTKKPY